MTKQRKTKAKEQRIRNAYFIIRRSEIDNTVFFNLEGRRVYFDKAAWADWLMRGQNMLGARLVEGAVAEGDAPFREWLEAVLPETVSPDEYLAAVEKTMRDTRRGRDVTQSQARAFLNKMRANTPGHK